MAYTSVDNPELNFQTVLWTGNGSARSITLDGSENMQPDWVWGKNRGNDDNDYLMDSVRGATKRITTNNNQPEGTSTALLTSFDSDGFSLGTSAGLNASGVTAVAWCWKAGGSASSNSNGSITSSVSASTDAGFSIVSFTGTGANATVGHGLGVAPACFITKSRVNAENWGFYHQSLGNGKQLELNTTAAQKTNSAYYNNTSPTSTVFSIGTADSTNDNQNMIAYCFAEKKGYSKFSSFSGNGNANGNFNYLGFRPSLIILKGNNTENWSMYDNKRLGYNVDNNVLYPNTIGTEGTSDDIDFLSNGFKIRRQTGLLNDSGVQYIYMAFAESPFTNSKGVPNNAR